MQMLVLIVALVQVLAQQGPLFRANFQQEYKKPVG
jgi:hypothetical protein